MEPLLKNSVTEIYALFTSKLTKIESLFLVGLYYSNKSSFTEDEIDQRLIIAQQLLTYLKRNPFPVVEDKDSIERLFLDQDDKVDSNCHPDFLIGDEEEINIEKIQNSIPEFNEKLNQPIVFNYIVQQPEEAVNSENEEITEEKIVEENPEDSVFKESDNAKETIKRFLKYYPPLTKKQQKRQPRSVLMLGISTGRFIAKFLNERFSVYFIENDVEKVRKTKKLPRLYRCKKNYLDCPEDSSLSAIWSYTAIARMKKDEIIQALKNIEIGLIDNDYACISFMYGNGHKTINSHYYTLMDEDSFRAIVAKAKNLEIKEMWTREYTRNDGSAAKRLNVILQKKSNFRELKIHSDEETVDTLPQSVDIQKIQLTSRISTMVMPEPGTEVEQKITISKDGRIWITRNKFVDMDDGLKTELLENKIISIDKDVVEKIFFMVYRSVFLNQRERICDTGEWELNITATNEDVYCATGSFGVPVLFRDKDVCKIIRESIPSECLWIFNDLDK